MNIPNYGVSVHKIVWIVTTSSLFAYVRNAWNIGLLTYLNSTCLLLFIAQIH